ncbi:hypothetical protein CQ476_08 [TM7 phage DolZOral124_53_65]|nr:hypothetical protein CQ476_08 [TM7 phage DolZOral124_53_65]
MDLDSPSTNDDEAIAETSDNMPLLSIKTDDRELVANFNRWIQDSNAYWNDTKGYNLKAVRDKNEKYYLGHQLDVSRLYPFQVPHVDNQIYVGTQSVMAYVSGNTPSCEVIPEDDTTQSQVMAQDLETAINTHTQRHDLASKVKSSTKNMYTKRLGAIKLKWDDKIGDIVPVVVDPERLVVDKDCRLGEEPRFISETCTDSVAALIKKFPDKEGKIMEALERTRKTPKLLGQIETYREVWFTDESADYGEQECVAWYMRGVILKKMKNPNYLYDNEGIAIENFIDQPTKPYVLFNYINDGSSLIDQTTPIEQAIPLQDVLNKRGRQIIENAQTANSILVLKAGSINTEDASNITRDPNQVLMLDTPAEQPIASAYGEIPPHLLPSYVIQDYQNTKNAIHNILGTPSQFRGDDSKRDVGTLGEAKMIQSQAGGRQDEIVREIERALDKYFRLLVQMMKVYYDETHKFATRDNDGKFTYVELSRENMPNIATISVSHGSLLKTDRERQENVSMALAKMGLIDPYNLFKDLSLKDAAKRYEALIKFKVDPTTLVSDVKSEVNDREAYIDFSVIMNGQEAEPRKDIQPSYILAMRKLMMTDQFLYAPQERQQALIGYVEDAVIGLAQRAKLEAADEAGVLVDPSVPVTPEPPEAPPPPPQGMMPGQPPMPPEAPPAPVNPMPAPPPVDQGSVMSNLLPM